ncbi:NPCBM/NEW2 domain-containing protein [Roseibacillus persicicus]|uniref:NPCBM/NEW2 domain-containing protein n=1 Tax=Roseibacillus persicicus TaxID=454148 RepID=UPI00398BB857
MKQRLPLTILLILFGICAWLFAENQKQPSPSPAPALPNSLQEQAAQARQILSAWQAENPIPSKRTLRVVYWTPSDREPAAAYRERLTRIMDHIQNFYRSEMERQGFGPLVFPLEKDGDGLLKIHLVRGDKPFAQYDGKSGSAIREECLPTLRAAGMDPNHETLLIFCNLATWDAEKKTFSHKSPYYAGGSHRGGNAWQLDSPELDVPNLLLKEPLIDDAQYGKISLGKHNSIFIGGIAHELGHALSLPHNRESPTWRKQGYRALMGDGNRTYGDELRNEGRGTHLQFAGALRLASQPLFSRSEKDLNIHARATLHDLIVTPGKKSFTFSGRVTANVPAYGIIAYLDPVGHGDYDARTVTAIPDAEGRFTLDCNQLRPNSAAELRILICHANGATNRMTYSYSVDRNGKPEVSTLQTSFALAPLVKALNTRDHSRLQAAFDKLHSQFGPSPRLDEINELARRLVAGITNKEQTPASNVPAERKSIPLSDIKPAEVKVGYGQPAYDHLPNADLLIASGGKLFPHGIYAHAPARHRYELAKGWKTLTGSCGLAENMQGSCIFIIKADGREVYHSPVIRAGENHPYKIDLTGVEQLELITSDGGDGRGYDWALWLTPTLHR